MPTSPIDGCPDDVPIPLLLASEKGAVQDGNASLCELLGWTREQLRERNVDQLFTPAARLLYHSYLLPLLRLHGELAELSLSLQCRDGRRQDVLLKVRLVPSAGVQAGPRMQFVFFPMRERRRLEAQLLSAKRAAEQVPGLLFELRRAANGWWSVPYASDALRHMYGIAPQAVIDDARPVWLSVHPDDRERVNAGLNASARALSPWRAEYRVCIDGHVAWRETHASPRAEADGSLLWHGYTADVTERRRLVELATEREAAHRADRARAEFLARISHELRTPLNGILGFAQLLQAPGLGVTDREHLDKVGHIEQAGRVLLRLVDEVLDITKMQVGALRLDMRTVDLARVVRDAVQLASPLADRRRVRQVVSWPWGDGEAVALPVQADAGRLMQCLGNLLSNAIKYGPDGGVLSVIVRWSAAGASVAVVDEGPGLTDLQMQHLFEAFNRLGAEQTQVEGSGLGLVITRGLVEMMGGHLRAGNRAGGGGACFEITLRSAAEPLAPSGSQGDADRQARGALARVPPRGGRAALNVLYVEDNDVNALLMAAVMDLRPDCALHRVASGAEALGWLAAHSAALILLDMHLPDMPGLMLLDRIRAQPGWRDIPVVGVSADALDESVQRAHDVGLRAYWTKPLDLNQVLPELDLILQTLPAWRDAEPA